MQCTFRLHRLTCAEFSRPISAVPRRAGHRARETAADQAIAGDWDQTGKRSGLFADSAASLPANPEAELYGSSWS